MEKIIDDARRHFFLKDFPSDIPIDQAYLHIGIFIGWVIDNELYSEEFVEEFDTQIFRFKRGEMSYVIMGELWDGLIFEGQFRSPEGQEFARYYYHGGHYITDFKETLAADLPSMYYVTDSQENYLTMKQKINERFAEWKANRSTTGA